MLKRAIAKRPKHLRTGATFGIILLALDLKSQLEFSRFGEAVRLFAKPLDFHRKPLRKCWIYKEKLTETKTKNMLREFENFPFNLFTHLSEYARRHTSVMYIIYDIIISEKWFCAVME